MKRLAVVLALGMAGHLAHAAPRATYRFVDPRGTGASYVAPAPASVSHVIFLDRCTGGCTLSPGSDGTQNQSDIINGQVHISAYAGTTTQWNQLVQCVKDSYAPFNVQIVTTRPAAGTHYHHAIVAGSAAEAGEQQGVLGVSPFTCGYIPDAISFTFANEEPTNIDDLCWTVSQETSHSWGLDHKYDANDPMTYLTGGISPKRFQDNKGPCGEYSARACMCTYDGSTSGENSVELITATFGAAGGGTDTTPPVVSITSPGNGATVSAGFTVTASVTDDTAVAKAELRVDGSLVGTDSTAPYSWTAPTTLGAGSHTVQVTGYDAAGNTANDSVTVTIGGSGGGCQQNSDCPSGQTCSSGTCVGGGGGGTPGGLGSTCSTNADCSSGQCASDAQGHSYCTQTCNPSSSTCPSGFGCEDLGNGSGVCWPGANSGGGGGGCDAGGSPGAPLLAFFGLAAVLITRRRRDDRG